MKGDYYTFAGFCRKTSPYCGKDEPFTGTVFNEDLPKEIKEEWVKDKSDNWKFETVEITSEHLYDTNGVWTDKYCRWEKRYTDEERKVGHFRSRYL